MPSTHTLQRGTGAAASVEGVTWGTNLSRTRQGDCQSKLRLRVQAALDKPLPMCSWQWGGTEREEQCAVVLSLCSLPGLVLLWYQGLQESGHLF